MRKLGKGDKRAVDELEDTLKRLYWALDGFGSKMVAKALYSGDPNNLKVVKGLLRVVDNDRHIKEVNERALRNIGADES